MAKTFSGLGTTAGLSSDRTSMTGMFTGQQFYETDTNMLFMYNGSAWVLPFEQRFARVDASGSSTTMVVNNIPAYGTLLKVYAKWRSSRGGFTNTGGRFYVNNLSGAADYSLNYVSGSSQENRGYCGQVAAANALTGEYTATEIIIPSYNSSYNSRCTAMARQYGYSSGVSHVANHIGATTGIGAVTSITLFDDVGTNIVAGSFMEVYISN